MTILYYPDLNPHDIVLVTNAIITIQHYNTQWSNDACCEARNDVSEQMLLKVHGNTVAMQLLFL